MIANAASAAFDFAAANPRGAANSAVRAAGRMAGMAGPDVGAVQQQGFPAWTWLAVGSVSGVLLGIWLASKHGEKLPSWLPGRGV